MWAAQAFEKAGNGSPLPKDEKSGDAVGHTQVWFYSYLFSKGLTPPALQGPVLIEA